MSRRKRSRKKDFVGDPKYNDILVARFSNYVMRRGKKSVAEALLYESFDIIEEKTGQRGIEVFKKALDNVKPSLDVASRRRSQLSGSRRSTLVAPAGARDAVALGLFAYAKRKDHGRTSGE